MHTDIPQEPRIPADFEARMRRARSEAFHAGLGQIRRFVGRALTRDAR